MTYRERREARMERLEGWADSRAAKSEAAFGRAHEIADMIPFGQPILVGHHSERGHRRDVAKIENGMRAGIDHGRMAEKHSSRAAEIGRQLDRSIYSDDVDAVEKLEQRIAELEAERDRVKRYNAAVRKAGVGPAEAETLAHELLDPKQHADLVSIARACPYQLGKNGAMPAYVLQNLGGNITRNRKRLEQLRRDAATRDAGGRGRGRPMLSRYGGTCPDCGATFEKGAPITYYRVTREAVHQECPTL